MRTKFIAFASEACAPLRSLASPVGLCLAVSVAIAASLAVGPSAVGQTSTATPETDAALEFGVPRPDFGDLQAIRFLTDSDYPPFNYLDEEGALSGFNVDLARALCDELAVECDIRTGEWVELIPTIERKEADAIVASIRPSAKTLERLDFTDAYYRTPARFVARTDKDISDISPSGLEDVRVGVIKGTGHETFLRDFFPKSETVLFDHDRQARVSLKKGEIDLLFGDGITLMFWLNGTTSESCCEFRGEAYLESRYFGEGIGIAVRKNERKLRAILNYGLARLRAAGRLEELYLRYFPLSVF